MSHVERDIDELSIPLPANVSGMRISAFARLAPSNNPRNAEPTANFLITRVEDSAGDVCPRETPRTCPRTRAVK